MKISRMLITSSIKRKNDNATKSIIYNMPNNNYMSCLENLWTKDKKVHISKSLKRSNYDEHC